MNIHLSKIFNNFNHIIMLREILAITGKPGLFKIISHGNKTLIVEDIQTARRFPVSPREKVVSLGDIAMYTESEDKPLGEILDLIYENKKGEKIDVREVTANPGLKAEFEKILSDFDKERVHDSDIKKLFNWYNILVSAGFDKFAEPEKEAEEGSEEKKDETEK